MTVDEFNSYPLTIEIISTVLKHRTKFQEDDGRPGPYKKILVSVSGGADSDRMIDLIERMGHPEGQVQYAYYDTGMEYAATKEHLDDLEARYGIYIMRRKAKMPVPLAVKKYGVPVFSKQISQYCMRLQKHGFKWEDKPFDELYAEYPRCKAALRWWCNQWGPNSKMNISRKKWLKEYMVKHPPNFPISDKCCTMAKKATATLLEKELNPGLIVTGVRKAEGGARSTAYSTCFDDNFFGPSQLRILFWWKKEDCRAYDLAFNIKHSYCYSKYGLDRTGCACCPFGRHWERELEAARLYEPKLYSAAILVFGQAYNYMRGYVEFVRKMEMISGSR